jgi:hypothetical protein
MPRRVRTNPDPGAIRSLTEESVMLYQTVNPATGALVETFAPIGDYELEKVLATAHNTFEIEASPYRTAPKDPPSSFAQHDARASS